MRESYLLKKVLAKVWLTFFCVILMFRALQLLYIVYSLKHFLFCWKGQADRTLPF